MRPFMVLPLLTGMLVAPLHAQEEPYDSTAHPRENIAIALKAARADNKLVLLDFGANWCLDCLVLTRLFEDRSVEPFLTSHFHVVSVDVGNFNRNLAVSREYGDPISGGIPAVVVLTPNGRMIASTKDGALESARDATPQQVLDFLKQWVALTP